MVSFMKLLFAVFVLFLLIGCSAKTDTVGYKSKTSGVNKMAKVLFVIAHKDFQDNELLVPRHLLAAEHEVFIASTETTAARGMLGAELNPDMTLEEALKRIDEFDAVIFVGGSGSKVYFDSAVAHKIAQNAKNVLAAICLAPVILANAGVLKGKKATVWDDGRGTQIKMIESKGAAYLVGPVVVDGNLVTASGPDVARMFAERINELLE